MTINRERVRLLVDALRSGRFQQGYGHLRAKNEYCCLGVACEVAMENGIQLNVVPAAAPHMVADQFDGHSSDLPDAVIGWYGFGYTSDPSLRMPPLLHAQRVERKQKVPSFSFASAIALNDTFKFSFDEIADCFEYTFLTGDPQ